MDLSVQEPISEMFCSGSTGLDYGGERGVVGKVGSDALALSGQVVRRI